MSRRERDSRRSGRSDGFDRSSSNIGKDGAEKYKAKKVETNIDKCK